MQICHRYSLRCTCNCADRAPAGALSADYRVYPNGTVYNVSLEIVGASQYKFSDVGMLGENVPLTVSDVQLFADNGSEVLFNWSTRWAAPSTITFDQGNYTVTYVAPLRDNHLQGAFDQPYNVSVQLPPEFDVRNPLLAGLRYWRKCHASARQYHFCRMEHNSCF